MISGLDCGSSWLKTFVFRAGRVDIGMQTIDGAGANLRIAQILSLAVSRWHTSFPADKGMLLVTRNFQDFASQSPFHPCHFGREDSVGLAR